MSGRKTLFAAGLALLLVGASVWLAHVLPAGHTRALRVARPATTDASAAERLRPAPPASAGIPMEFVLFDHPYPVLAMRDGAPDARGLRRREWLLQTDEAYGPARVEEQVRAGQRPGEETVLRREAFVAGEVLVKPREGLAPDALFAALRGIGAASWRPINGSAYWVARLPSPDLDTKPRALAALAGRADVVAAAEGNGLGAGCLVPDDPRFPAQYSLQNTGQNGGVVGADVRMVPAWDIQHASPAVIVAILDNGFDFSPPDLAPNRYRDPREVPGNGIDDDGNGFIDDWSGWDFVDNDNDPDPTGDHGTTVASILGAKGNNGTAIAGVTWEVQILPVKVTSGGGGGTGTTANLTAGINYARTKGVRIMSMSLAGYPYSAAMLEAIEAARTAGILLSISSGNAGTDNDVIPMYPGSYPSDNILAVTNTDNFDQLNPSSSTYGLQSVDLGAPGTRIATIGRNGVDLTGTGTSNSAPLVAGVAALLLAERPDATVADLRRWILTTVDPLPSLAGRCVSGGRLNAYAALRAAQVPPAVTSQPTSQTTTVGQTATFSIAVNGNGPVAYRWQRLAAGSTTWIGLNEGGSYRGVTSATLTVGSPTAAMSGDQFRCVATGSLGSVTGSAATLTVSGGAVSLLQYPVSLTMDGPGNLYVADAAANTIRKITPAGLVSTLAGTAGSVGSQDGTGSAARFNQPGGITVDVAGILYVSDTGNATIRRITPEGIVTTLAGSASSRGNQDGAGAGASFGSPTGIAVDGAGNLYVADAYNATIRQITPTGTVSTLAGLAASRGDADGIGSAARFNYPNGVAVDAAGTLYVADTYNHAIRRVTSGGVVSTLAGSAGINGSNDGTGSYALFNQPYGVEVDTAGRLYVADTGNATIRRITPAGVVTTLAGVAGIAGLADGAGGLALFNQPRGVVVDDSGSLYVVDTGNAVLRRVKAAGSVTTLVLTEAGTGTPPQTPPGNPPPPPTGTSSGGGGGGGAMEVWFVVLLALLGVARLWRKSRSF
jgi:subtilisin family serine protease/sugar lactone lactonase YvrE